MCKCYVGLKDAVEVQQPLSYRELAELVRTSTCFLNYRDTHGRKRGWWWKYKLDQADLLQSSLEFEMFDVIWLVKIPWFLWYQLGGFRYWVFGILPFEPKITSVNRILATEPFPSLKNPLVAFLGLPSVDVGLFMISGQNKLSMLFILFVHHVLCEPTWPLWS